MKRQICQFDNNRNSATVATPTCSSCCCCCCCLTTALASSTILARRVNKEAREKKIKDPIGLTILAVLFLPVVGLIAKVLYNLINSGYAACQERTYQSAISTYQYTYEVCKQPANVALPIILFVVPVIVLSYLYTRIKMGNPVVRAIVVTLLIWAAGIAEAFAGGAMILTGIGGPIYLCLVPVFFGIIQAAYGKTILHKEVTRHNSSDAWKS